jgi:hypothetical protein
MKKVKKNNKQIKNKHKRALHTATRRAVFHKLKENWKRGIDLYETYTSEERN